MHTLTQNFFEMSVDMEFSDEVPRIQLSIDDVEIQDI